jgi:hypothetical protein
MKYKSIATAAVAATVITAYGMLNQKAGPPEIYSDVPGAINADIQTPEQIAGTICNSHWSTSSIRPSTSYTNPIKFAALKKYNQEHGTSYHVTDGELDHLISIELGGSPTSTDNLWYEPFTTQVNGRQIGAHEKDKVENALHDMVCRDQITLQQAQQIISSDWYAEYLKLFPSQTFGAADQINDPDDN